MRDGTYDEAELEAQLQEPRVDVTDSCGKWMKSLDKGVEALPGGRGLWHGL